MNKKKQLGMSKTMITVVPILFCILILFSINSSGLSSEAVREIDAWDDINLIDYEDIKDSQPTFTTITTTTYYTSSLEDFDNNWCSPTLGKCFSREDILTFYENDPAKQRCINEKKGFCCINNKDRGFYEDVLCQGSGVANGKTYNYLGMKKTQDESTPLDPEFTNGVTAKSTTPIKKRTVAINPKAGSNCYIPYWTKMYIYFGEGNLWNGVYLAEDTGSAFAGKCKIDIYAGVGKESVNEAVKYVDSSLGDNPKIYLLNDNGKVMSPDEVFGEGYKSGLSTVVGTFFVKYANKHKEKGLSTLYDETYAAAKEVSEFCSPEEYPDLDEREICMYDIVIAAEEKGVLIGDENYCEEEGIPPYTIREIQPNWDYADIYGNITKEIISETLKVNGEDKKRLTVEISDGIESVIVHFWNESTDHENDLLPGNFVLLKDAFRSTEEIRLVHSKEQVFVNPKQMKMKALKEISSKLADCQTAEDNCLCEFEFNGKIDFLSIRKNTISFDDFGIGETIEMSKPLVGDDDIVLALKDTNKISLKMKGGIFESFDEPINIIPDIITDPIGAEPDILPPAVLQACEPTQLHYLMCAELAEDRLPTNHSLPSNLRVEPEYLPPMKFTLKI